jgi:hypothetical protein
MAFAHTGDDPAFLPPASTIGSSKTKPSAVLGAAHK